MRTTVNEITMLNERTRHISEWHEDYGPVLWWKLPVTEPPYVGTPNDLGQTVEVTIRAYGVDKLVRCQVGGWPGYHEYWTPIPVPISPDVWK
jgi:hypothetical protein